MTNLNFRLAETKPSSILFDPAAGGGPGGEKDFK